MPHLYHRCGLEELIQYEEQSSNAERIDAKNIVSSFRILSHVFQVQFMRAEASSSLAPLDWSLINISFLVE